MRLTLRTLLAYLDDTLEPAEIKAIGQKVAESDTAQELIARIKQVTRRRRLTTPPLTGPGVKWDPNTVAEYLDNELPTDQVSDLEKVCLESDVHLAEIAACHQILTLVLGEPALVPPTAKERMFALVKGREAVTTRKARASAAPETGDAHDEDDDLVLGLPPSGKSAWVRWALPAAGVLLFVALGASFFFALPSPRSKPDQNAQAKDGDQSKDAKPTDGKPTDGKPTDGKPTDGKPTDGKPTDGKPTDGKPTDGKPTDGKPTDGKPTDDKPRDSGKKDGGPSEAANPTLPNKPIMDVAPIGKFLGGFGGAPCVLAQRRPDSWWKLRPNTVVNSGQLLVSLPGYISEVGLDSGVGLLLRGHVKELTPPERDYGIMNFEMESSVYLHKNPDCDLDLTLNQGRIYLTNQKRSGPALVRLRFRTEVWDVTLDDPGTEVGVVLISTYTPNLNYQDEEPVVQVALFLLRGKAEMKFDAYRHSELNRPCGCLWDNKSGKVEGPRFLEPPPLWNKKLPPVMGNERIVADLRDFAEKLPEQRLASALQGVMNEERDPMSYKRVLVIYSWSTLDEVPKLLDVLDNESPERGLDRDTAIFALRRWLSRSLENGRLLFDPVKKTGYLVGRKYVSKEAGIIWTLLHDYKDEARRDRETYETLVDYLRSDKIAIRELAWWHLVRYAGPAGREVTTEYRPAAPPAEREKAAAEWRKLIDQGKLPPGGGPPPPMGMK